ncbi:MAG: sensor histidine kinase [Hyphomicrobium sp.]
MPRIATPAPEAAAPHARTSELALLPDLASDDGISFAVDANQACVVAASPAARAALGITPHQQLPVSLDSAMPALRRLRVIAKRAAPSSETLGFWSIDGRMTSRSWDIAPVNDELERPLLLLRGATAEPSPTESTIMRPRDEAETLKDMARRLREGPLDAPKPVEPTLQRQPLPSEPTTELTFTATSPRASSSALSPDDLARLAHELKTPLTAIAAAAEIMRDERVGEMGNPRYLDYARDIHESATHALAVIARLLARGDARDGERDRVEAIDLNDLVARTVATLQPLATERRVALGVDAAEGAPRISTSATALRQILLNLLSNALKFTPAHGDVRAVTGYLPNGAVFLAVRDTGDGIDQKAVSRALNEPEVTVAARDGGGYGIGLPLTCRLVADIGAKIAFDSAPGKGTVAIISF